MKKKIIVFCLSILFIPIEFAVAKEKFLSLKKMFQLINIKEIMV